MTIDELIAKLRELSEEERQKVAYIVTRSLTEAVLVAVQGVRVDETAVYIEGE